MIDAFTEMRTAALLQKVQHGPEALPAKRVLRMANIDGARALGLDHEIGSIEIGKKADLTIINLRELHSSPRPEEITSTLIYSAVPADVLSVLVDGKFLMKDRQLQTLDEKTVINESNSEADSEAASLVSRAGLK